MQNVNTRLWLVIIIAWMIAITAWTMHLHAMLEANAAREDEMECRIEQGGWWSETLGCQDSD